MLKRIHCDLFKIKDIYFKDGLNVVKGPDNAYNSIGKSTLLLIIDYCFGGTTYGKPDSDIIRNLGHHEIQFVFKFNNKEYYFSRLTSDPTHVFFYSEGFKSAKELKKLEDFNQFLFNYYFPHLHTGTFRSLVGRFSRIYGKENLNEKEPLAANKNEKQSFAITSLETIFNYGDNLYDLKNNLELIKKEKKAIEEAKKFNVIPNEIKNIKTYKEKESRLFLLKQEKEMCIEEENVISIIPESTFTTESIELKLQLNELLKKRTRIKYKINKLQKNIANHSPISKDEYDELSTFLPNIDIREIKEIEQFQRKIFIILKNEIDDELKLLSKEMSLLEVDINEIEYKLRSLKIPKKITANFISKITNLTNEINSIEKEIEIYKKTKNLACRIKEAKEKLSLSESSYLESICLSINAQMKIYNENINDDLRKQPLISLKDGDHYRFITPDDTGTGTLYKNMLILDLSILKLSSLPFVIHDSLLFKNIADYPINKLINLYNQFDKQIFISIDKVTSYNNLETTKIIDSNSIISLSQGNELFGLSWGKIKN